MADPPRTTSPPSAAGQPGGPDGLLATKLYVPRPPPALVPRPRLADLLSDGFARDLLLVCAPAGFGKTALLADWVRLRQQPVAWISLDTADNDPVRFWRHALAGLEKVRPGLGESVGPLHSGPSPAAFDALVTMVVNHLADAPGEVLLVLDDYHLIDAEPVHASVLFLVENAPPGLRVAVASRADPPWPLGRLRARGQLAELRVADLRFTVDEAAELLREAVGADLDAAMVARLTSRTEGWAAGLQLAGLSLRGQPDVAAFVESFSGSHRYVLDYLTEEILDRQPPSMQEFLVETSILGRLSGPLCDAVTGRSDSQRMLEEIERANLFLMPLDDVRGWWRYHHLFADLLRHGLQQRQPERMTELHSRAAGWHDEQGLAHDAVRHAIAAGDSVAAARLIERYFDEVFLSSEGVTLRRWLAELPDGLVDARPRLLIAQASSSIVGGLVEQLDDRLDTAERAYENNADEPFEPFQPSVGAAASRFANVPAAIAIGRAYAAYFRGDGDAAAGYARRALAELDDSEWMLGGLAHFNLSVAAWLRGELADAEQTMAASVAQWRASGRRHPTVLIWSYLGRIQCAQGRLDAALETYGQAVEEAPASPSPLPAVGVAYVGMADVAYHRNELDTALNQVNEGISLCKQFVYAEFLARGLVTLAWIRQATGNQAAALAAMTGASRFTDPDKADLFDPVPAERARLMLAQGDVEAAARWVAERGLSVHDEPAYPRERAYLVLARVLSAQGRPDEALHLLGRWHAAAVAHGRNDSVIEIQALRALALAAGGDDTAAKEALADALTLAHPQGYVRVFVDEGPPMAELLGRLIADGDHHDVPVGYLGRLVRAFDPTGSDVQAESAVPGLVGQLSARELEVLRLLSAGRSNLEIAEELFVTVNTVKKHVTHILDKLGATNRTEAVARARALGIVP